MFCYFLVCRALGPPLFQQEETDILKTLRSVHTFLQVSWLSTRHWQCARHSDRQTLSLLSWCLKSSRRHSQEACQLIRTGHFTCVGCHSKHFSCSSSFHLHNGLTKDVPYCSHHHHPRCTDDKQEPQSIMQLAK